MFGWLSWGLVMHYQWVWRLVAAWGALWDWLKVFRVGGAACGCSVGIGNPWQTLPLLLSSLMESEESLEVVSVSSTSPQSRHAASPQHWSAFSPFTLWATPILSWSLFISSVCEQRMLPHVNGLVITLFRVYLMGSLHMLWPQNRSRLAICCRWSQRAWAMTIHYSSTEGDLLCCSRITAHFSLLASQSLA